MKIISIICIVFSLLICTTQCLSKAALTIVLLDTGQFERITDKGIEIVTYYAGTSFTGGWGYELPFVAPIVLDNYAYPVIHYVIPPSTEPHIWYPWISFY